MDRKPRRNNEFVDVDPDHSKTSGTYGDQPRVLLARSQVVFVRVEGHLLHLHTVAGGVNMCGGER